MAKYSLLRSWPFWAAAALLVLSQIFYLALSFTALQKLQLESSLKVESLLLDNLADRLGIIVRTGRDLGRYPRLNEEMNRIMEMSRADFYLVADVGGKVLSGRAPAKVFQVAGLEPDPKAVFQFQSSGRIWIGRLILDRNEQPAAYVFVAPRAASGSELIQQHFQDNRGLLTGITVFSVLLLTASLLWGQERIKSRALSRFRMYALFLGPFLFGQFLFFGIIIVDISESYLDHNRQVAGQLARSLALDLDKLLHKGLPLADIPRLQEHLESLRENFPLAASIAVFDGRDRRSALAGEERPEPTPAEGRRFLNMTVVQPLASDSGPAGRVEVFLSLKALSGGWLRLFFDNATMALVASLLMMELARVIVLKLQTPQEPARVPPPRAAALQDGPEIMRPLVFGCLFALDMSLSFIPLKMAALDPDLWGLPQGLVLGLPISVEMGVAGVAMIAGGFLAGRLGGWRPLFLGGVLLASAGYGLSAVSASAGVYILARGLAGLGYGALNIAAQIFVIGRTVPGRQGEALGDLFAGFFSGGLCGCAAGGLLADRLGFTPVFIISSGLLLLLAGLVLLAPRDRELRPGQTPAEPFSFRRLARFIGSRPIWNMALLNVMPAAIVTVGLVNYFIPLHVSSLGEGPAVISQLNVLFSLLVVFLGPRFGRRLDGSRQPWLFLVLAGLTASAAFFPFLLWPSLLGALLVMVCLGLSNAVSENGQVAYLLGRPEVRLVGDNQALSLYNAVTRIGQVAGPLVLATAVGPFDFRALVLMGGGVLLLTMMFWLLAPKEARPG